MSWLKILSFILFVIGGLTLFRGTDLDLSNLKTWVIALSLCLSGFLVALDINLNDTLKEIVTERAEQNKDE